MSRNKTAEWHPFETAPKGGTELIFWVSSQKGFQDTSASFYFSEGQWRWADTEEVLNVLILSTDGCGIRGRRLSPERNNPA